MNIASKRLNEENLSKTENLMYFFFNKESETIFLVGVN